LRVPENLLLISLSGILHSEHYHAGRDFDSVFFMLSITFELGEI